jgi:hypothetical protein
MTDAKRNTPAGVPVPHKVLNQKIQNKLEKSNCHPDLDGFFIGEKV